MLIEWHNAAGDRLMPGEHDDWLDVDYVRQWGQAHYRYCVARNKLESEAERLAGTRATRPEEKQDE